MNIWNFMAQTTAPGKIVSLSDPLSKKFDTIWGLFAALLDVVVPLAAIMFVGMFVYSGVTYIQSSGDSQKVKLAQAMMTNAIIGFVIISFAFVILKVLEKVLGI